VAGNYIARVYATALFDTAQKNNMFEQLNEELEFVAELLAEEKDVKSYLLSPSFSKDAKKDFVKKVFSGNLSEYIVNFLYVLIENGRQSDLPEITAAFGDLMDDLNNRMKVDVVSVSKLDSGTLENIKSALKKKFNKDVVINEKTDKNILGGIIIKAGDLVIDGSLAENLKKIRYSLLNSKVRSEVAYED
jgi:F-type H+-transporting ATPase subunit delta